MSSLLTTLIIGVSLSMDAFSLALVYGTTEIGRKNKVLLAIIVGLFHFFMPLIGLYFGSLITRYLIINVGVLVAIIFSVIGGEMIVSGVKGREEKLLVSLVGFLLFGFSVSIDSLTTGIGLNVINSNYLQVATIFALVSGWFTYFGLHLGNKLSLKFGNYATIIGGIILIILGIYYVFR